jgi:hypothetical protein
MSLVLHSKQNISELTETETTSVTDLGKGPEVHRNIQASLWGITKKRNPAKLIFGRTPGFMVWDKMGWIFRIGYLYKSCQEKVRRDGKTIERLSDLLAPEPCLTTHDEYLTIQERTDRIVFFFRI